MNKSESKYFNTALKMDKAFLKLLEIKDFEYITVKEICKYAGVNRSTFYLHYETIGDLLSESIQYMNGQFLSYFSTEDMDVLANIEKADLNDLFLIKPELLKPYLTFIFENKKLFLTSLSNADSLRLTESYDKMFTHILSPILDRFEIPENKKKYIITFYINGIIAVIREWLKNDCLDSIDFIIHIIESQVPKV